MGGPEVLTAGHLLLVEGPAGTPGSALPWIGWHGGFERVGQASGRWMPMAPEPAEGHFGQAPVGRLGSLLRVEQSEQGGWLENLGREAEGPAGESEQWPHWRSQQLPVEGHAQVVPTTLAFH